MTRPIPSIPGFHNLPISERYSGGLLCCWDFSLDGGKISDIVEWLKTHRPCFKKRVTAIIRTMKHTWVVDVCEENVRITHFRNYNTWMSERMKLWWQERKNREVMGKCILGKG